MAIRRARRVGAAALVLCAACESRTVVPVEVATVQVDPSSLEVVVGESRLARAISHGPGGELLSGRTVSWATADATVATVDGDGNVTGARAGLTTLRATVEGVTGTAPVTVLSGASVALSESAVQITAFAGSDSDPLTVQVTNGGHGVLSGLSVSVAYRAGDPTGWLTAGLGGTTAPTALTLSASAASLAPGAYRASVTVASALNGGSSAQVVVDLTVQSPPPAIVLDIDAVSFSGVVGGQVPAVQEVAITNGGSGTLTGLATAVIYQGDATGWLQATLDAATAPTTLRLQASVGLLGAGRYSAQVEVRSDVASNSPRTVTVDFEVAPVSAPGRR